jgi:hypothetical protein
MRSNYKYFSRIEKNRTPDRTHRVTSNYYRFKNTPDRSNFKTTVYSNNNYLRRDEIYPRTPNYVQSHKRIKEFEKVNNYTPSENINKPFNKVTVKRNNYSNVNQNVVNKQKKS